jgi:hypothetical protein
VLGGDLGQAPPALVGQRAAGRVLERRHEVEELRRVAGDELGERLGVDAVVVAVHRHEPGAREREALQRGEVGRVLDQDAVAGVEQDAGDEPERLLGPGRHEDLARARGQSPQRQALRQQLAQQRVALGRRVLQPAGGDGRRERRREGAGDELGREELRRRQPAREGDDLVALRELEDVADRGGADVRELRGEGGQGSRHPRTIIAAASWLHPCSRARRCC